jgi:hypothetical protein
MTLLVPVAGASAEPPAVIELRDAAGRPSGVRFVSSRRSVRIDNDSVFLD